MTQTPGPFPPHVEVLLRLCREEMTLDPRDVLEAVNDPQWNKAGRVHDWRNHIQGGLEDIWDQLGLDARLSLYLTAAIGADREEWD